MRVAGGRGIPNRCQGPGAALLAGALALFPAACGTGEMASAGEAPPDYVGAAVCGECHREALAAWTGSDHERAMAPATPATVLGDFDDVTFSADGVDTRFFREGDRFLVRTDGPDGAPATFEVTHTFGVRPLQQYLVELEGGRVQALTVAWDVERERWFSLRPGEAPEPGSWRHWTGGAANWNAMCADCHSTGVVRGFDPASLTWATTFEEVNVACEACHGPGSVHVEWARGQAVVADGSAPTPGGRLVPPGWMAPSGVGRAALGGDGTRGAARAEAMGLTVALGAAGSPDAEIETCAFCHSVRQPVSTAWVPGEDFDDHWIPELLDGPLWHPDGQPLEEVFEYGALLQSRMYQQGIRCSTCHEPHSSRLRLEGNALCTGCHSGATYDTPDHHFHAVDSTGSACVACHMPEQTFMQVDARRDHGFRIPRPDVSAALGTPDACTGCHDDRSVPWAAGWVASWYGPPSSGTAAETLAAGRATAPGADSALAALAVAGDTPDMVRASAVSLLGRYRTPAAREAAAGALADTSSLVRVAAVRALQSAPASDLLPLLAPRLEDPARAVRVEAARALSGAGGEAALSAAGLGESFRRALAEYRGALEAVADQPEGQLDLGVLEERSGDPVAAERAYLRALRLDSTFIPALVNLATLVQRMRPAPGAPTGEGTPGEAETLLRRAVALDPGGAEGAQARYALGLLLAEEPARLSEAADHLAAAAAAAPGRGRIQYNAGLAHQHLGRDAEAEAFLRAAHEAEPGNPDYLNAVSIFYVQQERWDEALRYTDRLLALVPGATEVARRREVILRREQGDG